MARLVIRQHIETGPEATVNELGIQSDMVKVTVQNEHRAPVLCRLRQAEVMHHHLMPVSLDVALVINHLRVLYPEVEPVKAAIGFHLGTELPWRGRIKRVQPLQQGMSVPIGYFYGICFPVHVELNACHESIIGDHRNAFTRENTDVPAAS